ncbi:MAG TPA: sugar phosphate isomerase/epimerase [Caldilineae bacterium]|nr:sugar phosphate isomerase/epimerase [Caldilineae bacterium]
MSLSEIGMQSYTYRKFSVQELVDQAQSLGISAVELWPGHLPPDASEATVEEVLAYCRESGVRICGYGVVNLSQADIRQSLAFAKRLGVDYVSVDVHPEDVEGQREAVAVAEELGLKLAIHNHGPTHHYSTPEDVVRVIEAYPEVFGACVDTGHFLRSGVDPVAAIERLSPRVHAVHIKDFLDERTEVLPGTGRLNLSDTLRALRAHGFATAYVIEYEAEPEDPTPDMQKAVAAVREALAGLE